MKIKAYFIHVIIMFRLKLILTVLILFIKFISPIKCILCVYKYKLL